ncbi:MULTISPECIES: twin-arginine translocase TatA/TatE family subunit [unclassified Janthinobacterium]|uniref:twin-arginine translocase TatA/TatE family subunit n=1 Tax=unclassified Janthinobacterium TaxID=2610881 RepID=UPI001619A74F|nr:MULTISPECIES: twin-arginine translocase TatA/TatE family subunit [unclassified Janthinobacterium]MBB5370641.1 sec-independent protein translocase protein TatB [Janthinobacterium sp. K2C7]MBB5383447.1 sec-independent protein translocase protein TatB [Janthinobacterium sp. K2Li3]MBB5388901.1 sec-independent protein translocase protein TatB [Janthinobacterium sp. K2E3]
MFGLDISKMAVIGTVALVVLGPERLPRVARTLGTLLGRAQRYLNSVQQEVAQQMQLDELRKLSGGITDAIGQEVADVHQLVERTVRQHAGQWQAGVDAMADGVQEMLPGHQLLSVHEAGLDVQAELFKVRPAPLPISRDGAGKTSLPGQPSRAKWRSNGRGMPAKRSRVVSMAASKSLGR